MLASFRVLYSTLNFVVRVGWFNRVHILRSLVLVERFASRASRVPTEHCWSVQVARFCCKFSWRHIRFSNESIMRFGGVLCQSIGSSLQTVQYTTSVNQLSSSKPTAVKDGHCVAWKKISSALSTMLKKNLGGYSHLSVMDN
jgi:hypothetical protein